MSSRRPAQIFATSTGWVMKSSPGSAPLVGVALAGEGERALDRLAVDPVIAVGGVLADHREQVAEQRAIVGGQPLGELVRPGPRARARRPRRRPGRGRSDPRGPGPAGAALARSSVRSGIAVPSSDHPGRRRTPPSARAPSPTRILTLRRRSRPMAASQPASPRSPARAARRAAASGERGWRASAPQSTVARRRRPPSGAPRPRGAEQLAVERRRAVGRDGHSSAMDAERELRLRRRPSSGAGSRLRARQRSRWANGDGSTITTMVLEGARPARGRERAPPSRRARPRPGGATRASRGRDLGVVEAGRDDRRARRRRSAPGAPRARPARGGGARRRRAPAPGAARRERRDRRRSPTPPRRSTASAGSRPDRRGAAARRQAALELGVERGPRTPLSPGRAGAAPGSPVRRRSRRVELGRGRPAARPRRSTR